MWVHALDGQSLGLVRGWRDLRDGLGSKYASLVVRPAWVEAVSHTALDLARLGRHLPPFRRRPALAIAIDETAFDPQDDNLWAPWITPIWQGLVDRQFHFDVVDAEEGEDRLRDRYPAVLRVNRDDAGDVTSVLLRVDRLASRGEASVPRCTLRNADGELARDVFVRIGETPTGRPCVAVVNLTHKPRRLRLEGGPQPGPMHDVIADTPVRSPWRELTLEGWQVRLLWPED
jgi:hypothetical protein